MRRKEKNRNEDKLLQRRMKQRGNERRERFGDQFIIITQFTLSYFNN